MKKIAITAGDINGIGTEVLIKALNRLNKEDKNRIILITDTKVLDFWQEKLGIELDCEYEIEEVELIADAFKIGEDTAISGEFSYNCLNKACEMAKVGEIGAITTCPVSKNALHLSEHDFSGQTEILENLLSKEKQKTEMLFVANDFRVMLLTRHIALCEVAKNLNKEMFEEKIKRLISSLQNDFKIQNPKVAICALNPHAGENGILGREEIEILIPVIEKLNKSGYNITMPKPSDTLFAQAAQEIKTKGKPNYDCYVAIYHDQGLIPIKLLAFNEAVNTTIGLDIIRTSPAHGTGFDIAGKNKADENSMLKAIKLALKLS